MLPLYEEPILEITALNTFFHFHFAAGYVFPGERHPFWEMVCVLGGQVDIGADEQVHVLGAGDVIFHRPNEFHSIWANYAHAPDLLVVTFECGSPAMRAFEKRLTRMTERQQALFVDLLREAKETFLPSSDSHSQALNPAHPGGVFAMRVILTHILLDMLSSCGGVPDTAGRTPRPVPADAALIQAIVDQMRSRLRGDLTFPELCRSVGMSGTSVKQLFRRYFSASPMAYYEQLRMSEARRRLREEGRSVAEVADELGFSSASYFSTRFKRAAGMSPREFLREARQ